MTPWQTLNIEPTKDKKAIKKAYAILLKKYKPDEFPKEFQGIQGAYQFALSWAKLDCVESPLISVNMNLDVTFEPLFSKNKQPAVTVNQVEEVDTSVKLLKELMAQIHALAFSPLAIKNEISNWKFVEEFLIDFDIQQIRSLAIEVFEKVAEFNLFQMKQNSTLLISPSVLKYLNHIFDWNDLLNNYNYQYSQDVYDVTFHYLEPNNIKQNRTIFDSFSLIKYRIWSQFIDVLATIFIFFMLVFLLRALTSVFTIIDQNIFVFFYLIYSLERLFLELNKVKHASLGKLASRQIIIDQYGNYANKVLILKRHLIFQFNLSPFYLGFLVPEDIADVVFLLSFLLIIIVNLILILKKKGFIHDYFSGTMVTRIETHTYIV